MNRKLWFKCSWDPDDDNDYDWCREEVYKLVQQNGDDGIWEDRISDQLMYFRGDLGRVSWAKRSPGQRAVVVNEVLSLLISATRIESIPEKRQATGRRYFRAVNILDTIVAALDSCESDA